MDENEDKYIPGIYNFCDRWCERCTMTARCRLYADEQLDDARYPDSRDPKNKEFWERISANFQKAFDMLQEMMDREGIVITEEDLAEGERRERTLEELEEADPLGKAGMDYGMAVHDWFKHSEKVFAAEADDLVKKAELDLPGADPMAEAERLKEAVEVIRWYGFQIGVKLKRAISSAQEDEGVDWGDWPSDADGSAKIALIGIDRSIGAWQVLHERFSEGEGESRPAEQVFDFMVQLDRLRRGVEERFPNARTTKRPGFDD